MRNKLLMLTLLGAVFVQNYAYSGEKKMTMDKQSFKDSTWNAQRAYRYYSEALIYEIAPYSINEAIKNKDNSIIIVDVRDPEPYKTAHIPGAINLPFNQWDLPKGLNKEKTIVVYCYSITCNLAKRAVLHFLKQSYTIKEMKGGWSIWQELQYPTEQ